jgi:hypothetical protein
MSTIYRDAAIVFVLIVVIIIYLRNKEVNVAFVPSHIDNKDYLVRDLGDKQEAADLLANINKNMLKLCDHLKQSEFKDNEAVQRLLSRFDPNNSSENINETEYTTYTLNKGEKIVYCLRSRDGTNKLHDINTLVFVATHEL